MDELIAVVDKNDKPLRVEERDVVHSMGLWHRLAHILLYNKQGELLLQIRSPKKKVYPNKWDCSITEHVKPEEPWRDAAERGLREELGIDGVKLRELLYCRANYGDEGNVISKVFECVTDKKPKNIDKEEVYGYKFFKETEIREMLAKENDSFAIWSSEQLRWKLGMPNKLERVG